LVLRSLERALGRDFIVEVFETVDQLLAKYPLAQLKADALVIDLGLSGTPGIEFLQAVRSRKGAQPKILVYTCHDDRDTVLAVMKWKPDGYVVKDDLLTPAGQAVRDLVAGGKPLSPAAARILIDAAAEIATAQLSEDSLARVSLSRKELQVFQALADASARDTNAEIATRLGLADKTLETHITHIYDKLGFKNDPDARAKAITKGRRLRQIS